MCKSGFQSKLKSRQHLDNTNENVNFINFKPLICFLGDQKQDPTIHQPAHSRYDLEIFLMTINENESFDLNMMNISL